MSAEYPKYCCVECGEITRVDEDACCAGCGAEVVEGSELGTVGRLRILITDAEIHIRKLTSDRGCCGEELRAAKRWMWEVKKL